MAALIIGIVLAVTQSAWWLVAIPIGAIVGAAVHFLGLGTMFAAEQEASDGEDNAG
ncbi:hypothetical protein JNB62_13990 [Microbacterium jejuense]|uniref:Uncharacterized protein n=1 Tax=Microbacterium jejuense TaxID=1263637 RepID=A0ABS7HQV8_9MICO|nr:hypothetical protein [Microbacterium jejuense]MBW9094800.1 hypothetical protein [Microbacterium jejuense]